MKYERRKGEEENLDRMNRMGISGMHGPLIPAVADRTVRYLGLFLGNYEV